NPAPLNRAISNVWLRGASILGCVQHLTKLNCELGADRRDVPILGNYPGLGPFVTRRHVLRLSPTETARGGFVELYRFAHVHRSPMSFRCSSTVALNRSTSRSSAGRG